MIKQIKLREVVFYLLFFITTFSAFGQGATCEVSDPFCADASGTLVFENSHPGNGGSPSAEPGIDYSCTTGDGPNNPNQWRFPAWYFLRVRDSGDLEFTISQSENPDGTGAQLDVDYQCWGPFDSPENCGNISSGNRVDCSWLPNAQEEMLIPNAVEGEFYLVMITNFSQQPGWITIQQQNQDGGSTDCSIVIGNLGEDQVVCEGTEVELDGTTEDAVTYEWYRDITPNNGTEDFTLISGETGPTITINDNVSAIYRLVVFDNIGTSDSDEVLIEFRAPPEVQPSELSECDDGDNTANFNLTDADDDITDEANVIITYHETEQQAIDGTNSLSSPFNSGETTIFARVEYDDLAGCFSVTTVDLLINNIPQTNTGAHLSVCSDSGTHSFDLTELDNQVSPNPQDVTITYHESEAEAEAGTPELPNPFSVSVPSTTIWVRVENADNCFGTVSAELIINETPNPNLPDLAECDDGSGSATFDLDAYINQLQTDTPDVTFSIHETETEAENGTNPLTGNYTLDSNNSPQSLWVSMTNQNATNCTNVGSFELMIQDEPGFNTISTVQVCDEDGDGFALFDLDNLIDDIRASSTDIITFHETIQDAINGDNALTSPYQNSINPQTIFVRVESAAGCILNTPYSFEIEVLEQPDVIEGQSLELCSPDGTASFNLNLLDDDVTSDPTNTITYHNSETEAQAGSPELPNPFTVSEPSTTIWVRVENADGCFDTVSAELIVTNSPNIELDDFESCEDNLGSETTSFNLDDYLAELQTTYPNLTLSIHPTEAEAEANTGELTGAYTNTTNPEELWVRVIDPAAPECNDEFPFNLVVNELPTIQEGPFVLEECDVDETGTALFDLTQANAQIDPSGEYTFTYHESQEEAENGTNELDTDHPSTNNGTVWARVLTENNCQVVSNPILLTVNPLPQANDASDSVCSQTTVGTFNLDNLMPRISTAAGVTISFHESQDDAIANTGPLPSSYDTEAATIFARVTNDDTQCFKITEVDLEVIVAPNTNIENFQSCENANSGEASFDLEDLRNQIETDTGGTVTLHLSQTEAEESTNPVSGIWTSANQTIWAKIETSLVDCEGIRPIELQIIPSPPIESFEVVNCRASDNPNDFVFDTSTLDDRFDYKVYESFADADTDADNVVSFPYTTTQDETQLFVRLENIRGCHSISTLDFIVTDFVDNPLDTIIVCYGETFTLPDGREIPPEDGQYTYFNEETCTNDIYTFDFQVCNPEVYCRPLMPTAFSPNASNTNDVFQLLEPLGCSLEIESITIFNRWGEVVYTATGNNFGWDGTFNNAEAQKGVYLWDIKYSWIDDQGNEGEQTHSGSIFLLR